MLYQGGEKRRPRSEWLIQHDTHDALITEEEAETLLGALENSSRSQSRRTPANYLLSGILKSPDGTAWHSDGEGNYRAGKGKRIKAATMDAAVLSQLAENLQAEDLVSAFTAAAKTQVESRMRDTELPRLRKELASIDRQISRVTELLAQTATPAPLLRQIETYEQRRQALGEDVAQRAELEKEAQAVRNLTEMQVARIMKGLAEDMESLDRDHLKDFIRGLIEKVELDPVAATIQLTYYLNAGN